MNDIKIDEDLIGFFKRKFSKFVKNRAPSMGKNGREDISSNVRYKSKDTATTFRN